MDNLITASNVARNKRDGSMAGISTETVQRKIKNGEDFVFLDVRSPQEYAEVRLPRAQLIPLGALRAHLDEIPKDKEIVAFCKISLRGYEAALILEAAGFRDVKVLDGGVAMWPYEKEIP
jgi:rhodanese-related sulfurtransferase